LATRRGLYLPATIAATSGLLLGFLALGENLNKLLSRYPFSKAVTVFHAIIIRYYSSITGYRQQNSGTSSGFP
jgi:hypothetical protein